jgi:hypothetical protein
MLRHHQTVMVLKFDLLEFLQRDLFMAIMRKGKVDSELKFAGQKVTAYLLINDNYILLLVLLLCLISNTN